MKIITSDSTFTLFNTKFNEHYHSISDGAYNETLYKHVIPVFQHCKNKDSIKILDICFGLGYNTLCFLEYANNNNYKGNIEIYSPEINLIHDLYKHTYPKQCDMHILEQLCKNQTYKSEDNKISIFLHIGDARKYLSSLQNTNKFDAIFQDAFSPNKNKSLWTYEYFKKIYKLSNDDAIVTTYSQNSSMLYSAFLCGFKPYLLKQEYTRDSIILTKNTINQTSKIRKIDMEHKIKENKNLKGIYD